MTEHCTLDSLPTSKQVHLDPDRMICSNQGLSGFFWPIAPYEYRNLRDVFISSLVNKLRNRQKKEQENDTTLVVILLFHLAIEVLGTYQAAAIRRRAGTLGCDILIPKAGRLWPFIFSGELPPDPPLIAELTKGPPTPSHLRLPARYLRGLLLRDGFRRYHHSKNGLTKEIYCISTGPLLSEHAKMTQTSVNYAGPHNWLRSAQPSDPAEASIIQDVVDSLEEGFRAGNEILEPWLGQYFCRWITKATALVRTHLNRVLEEPERLPSHLWTGSGAQIWARILRCAVKNCNGNVTGHDHGIGAGHIIDRTKTLRDFEFCDSFITFTNGQVSSLKENFEPSYLMQSNQPHISHLSSTPLRIPNKFSEPSIRPQTTPRRVLYLSQISEGEVVHLMPFMADPVFLDWVTRVLAHIVAGGFQTHWRPHPTARIRPSQQFLDSRGIRTINGSIHEAARTADVLLFDSHQTTSFAEIQTLSMPIVLIDFGLRPLVPRARSLIRDRCTLLSGWFDDNNQAQADWSAVETALRNTQARDDLGFANEYISTFSRPH